MNERPTPETDAEHQQFAMGGFTLDFCRKLERERDEARELLESEKITRNHIIQSGIKMQKERDEAREKNAKLRDIAEMAICLLQEQTRGYECSADNDTCKCTASIRDSLRAEFDQLKEGAK